jgi:hypothetical protein
MATTRTNTRTFTFTRIELIKMQISIALRRTTIIPEDKLDKLLIGIENKWVEEFSVYAFDNENLCKAQLVLKIDWEKHTTELNIGNTEVTIDKKWESNTSIELDESIKLFNSYVKSEALWTEWRIQYTLKVKSNSQLLNSVREVLGTQPSQPIRWGGDKDGTEFEIPELREMKIGCYIVT